MFNVLNSGTKNDSKRKKKHTKKNVHIDVKTDQAKGQFPFYEIPIDSIEGKNTLFFGNKH